MTTHVNTVVVGGGQAGLSVSYYLKQQGTNHLVLEQAHQPGEAWRNHRWESFTLNTPNWQSRLPGPEHPDVDPDAFMSRNDVIAYLENFAKQLPVRYGARVSRVEHDGGRGHYQVILNSGEIIRTRNVVMATGLYQTPKVPTLAAHLPPRIRQFHSDAYRNPQELLPGAVLVVGSAQSGAQIAEELYEAGRKVYLATGRAGRTPRRYRSKDANWWFARMGSYDRNVSELPSPKAKFSGKPHISGTRGGHTINLHQFARDGVVLLGRLAGVEDNVIRLAPDLHANLAAADRAEADFVKSVDAYIARTGMAVPEETLPVLRDGFEQPVLTELDLETAGVTNVIWATGHAFDFSMIRLPVVDGDGFPIQTRGVSAYPGLFFVGLPWLHTAKSGLIYGVAEDASYIADRIAERHYRTQPATGATRRFARSVRAALSAAAFALSVSSASGSEQIKPPAAPHVSILTTPASQLSLGMTAQDVTRVMGEPAKEKDFVAGGIAARTLEFSGAIPSKVLLADGKVSNVELDTFRVDKGDLPAFSQKAWPGMAEAAVRHALGEPSEIIHHTFFGINVDQWVYLRAGEGCISLFFRADRIVAKAVGRDVPADLFRVNLPLPPQVKGEDLLPTPRLGMTASDVDEICGPVKFRVDYVANGRSASRVVYENSTNGAFIGITFVDGVVTGLEDLGQMPNDPTFQVR